MLKKDIEPKCENCGKPLEPKRLLKSHLCESCEKKEKESVTGIGGWLMFFIFTLIFVAPIYSIYNLVTLGDIFSPIISIFAIIVGINLWKKKSWAVKGAKIYLIVLIIAGFLGVILVCNYDTTISCAEFFGENLIMILAYPTIWYTYLRKSKRVKNTYFNKLRIKVV